MDDIKIKKELIDKIKSSSNILITVSNDPSVDELSAALGLTLALNKIEKYATAIFSGATPPAISFLEPEKTFENNTDSLRDFIIALNREKADHLRFKPDGDYVKIFITPYRSVITPEDLEFSQGDFNVELVITLGVDNKEHLDDALDNYGQILHDATVVSITSGEQTSSLGNLNWHNPKSSSISEMVTGLIEALKEDKKEPIIDGPIATALLTGIVAETDRFSNSHTTSGVMSVAANLMNAGADQQLIAFKLEQSHEISEDSPAEADEPKADDDSAYTLTIDRETKEAKLVPVEDTAQPAAEATNAYTADEAPQAAESQDPVVESTDTVNPPQEQAVGPVEGTEPAVSQEITSSRSYIAEPSPSSAYGLDAADTAAGGDSAFPGAPQAAPGSVAVNEMAAPEGLHSAYATDEDLSPQPEAETQAQPANEEQPVLAVPEPPQTQGHDRLVIEPPTLGGGQPQPPQVPPAPTDLGLPMPPPLPDFSAGAAPPPAIPIEPVSQPEILGDILQPEPAIQPAEQPAPQPALVNPGQFQIPGQQ